MMCKSSWTEVEQQLVAVVNGSCIGETVFGRALASLKHSRAGNAIQNVIKDMLASERLINGVVLQRCKN